MTLNSILMRPKAGSLKLPARSATSQTIQSNDDFSPGPRTDCLRTLFYTLQVEVVQVHQTAAGAASVADNKDADGNEKIIYPHVSTSAIHAHQKYQTPDPHPHPIQNPSPRSPSRAIRIRISARNRNRSRLILGVERGCRHRHRCPRSCSIPAHHRNHLHHRGHCGGH
ncbi:uncharacterized protein LOC110180210 [Drosophila serrata]|uniref:uncharacterized protein LOC110180210 n=1 Tax=Drosophila serrata TaxID=7274 RepID=UPI000A1D0921|nr:uncharacterized protein LOC110180210 [Drosophila serrata]